MIPGVSTALVLRNSVAGGVRAGLETAVGLNASSFCYGLLSAFGFAIALQRWPWAWALLRGVGALYLSWLGLQSIKRSVRPPRPTVLSTTAVGSAGDGVRNAREGFVTNTLNPSIATFYLVLLPQFIPRGAPVVRSALVLTAIHISLAAIWHGTLGVCRRDAVPYARIRAATARPRIDYRGGAAGTRRQDRRGVVNYRREVFLHRSYRTRSVLTGFASSSFVMSRSVTLR